MPPVRFEPTISAGERPQTYDLDRASTGTGIVGLRDKICLIMVHKFKWVLTIISISTNNEK